MKRIFVSSTFKDMHEERDALRDVAAELNDKAFRMGDGVTLCDLRWGVDTLDLDSDQGAAKVLDVCLSEIDRCRPYMIVLLGDRYGWIPNGRLIRKAVRGRCERLGRRMSVTALEIEYGALLKPGQMARTLFYFREHTQNAPEQCKSEDAFHAKRLAALKKKIIEAGGHVRGYRLEWNSSGKVVSGLDSFKSMVRGDLDSLFQSDWKELRRQSSDQREQQIHFEHMKRSGEQFRGRSELLAQCLSKIEKGTSVFAIQGESGTGKTTLLGRLALELSQRGYDVLPIFCGLTVNSDDARDVMRLMIRYCSCCEPLPRGKTENWESWTEVLAKTLERHSSSNKRLVIVVDGVDQLKDNDGRNNLLFVPTWPMDNVQMVMSGLPMINFKGRMPVVKIGNLSKVEVESFLRQVSGEKGAELDRTVRRTILSKPVARNPLFLALLRYRLSLMDRDDYAHIETGGGGMIGISRRQREIVERCGTSLPCLCADILSAVEKRVQSGWIRTVVSCIAISSRGLREKDLEGDLTNLGLSWNPLDFSRFRIFLRAFFIERDDGRIDLSHSRLRSGLLPGGKTAVALRNALLQWFDSLQGEDKVRDEEFFFLCQANGDAVSFLGYVDRFRNDNAAMDVSAKSFYSGLCSDGGAFANRMLDKTDSYEKWMALCDFVNFHVYDLIDDNITHRNGVFCLLENLSRQGRRFSGRASDATALRRQLGVLNRNLADLLADNGTTKDRRRSLTFYRKARQCFERTSRTWRRATENDFRDIVSVLLGMGAIYEDINSGQRARKALTCYLEAAKLMLRLIKRFGKDVELELQFNVLYHLGDWYWRAGSAEELDLSHANYMHALSILESAERAGRMCVTERDKAICLTRLAQYHHEHNTPQDLKLEIYYGEKALEIDSRIYRSSRTSDAARDYMQSCMTLSETYINTGSSDGLVRAKDLCSHAVSVGREWLKYEQSLEAENILAQSYGVLANVCRAMGDLSAALRFCRMAACIFQRLFDSGFEDDCHLNLTCDFFNMGVILYDKGGRSNLGKAKLCLEKCLQMDENLRKKRRSWRREHDFIKTNVWLGKICRALGGSENCTKAVQYYRRAARLGNCDALFSLGCLYEEGLGVKPDKNKALHYFTVAASGGLVDAVRKLKSFRQA